MTVFKAEAHYRLFLEKLAVCAEEHRVDIRAYCLLANHFHLYLCTPEGNLSRFMQVFLTSFAISFNRLGRGNGFMFGPVWNRLSRW